MKKLNAFSGISMGIGSIMGSGILFLPSMTMQVGGENTLIAWVFTMLLCLPGLYFFGEMVNSVQDESGMAGFVALGLGKNWGNSIPLLLLGTVCLGMPSAAIIASKYVQNTFLEFPWISFVLPFCLVYVGIYTTIKGLNTGSFLNSFVAFLLFAIGAFILFLCLPYMPEDTPVLPRTGVQGLMKASVLAFWAFAGFENLTFLAKEFEKPKRDLMISAFVSIVLCGGLYYGLTFVYGRLIPYDSINAATGLAQLSDFSSKSQSMVFLIASFAVFAVLINLVSWTAGVSRAIVSSAREGMLPGLLAKLDPQGNPRNAALFLGALFTISLIFSSLFPEYFESLLTLVSTNLLILYLLGLVAFFRFTKKVKIKLAVSVFILPIIFVLLSSGLLLIYPMTIICLSWLISRRKEQRRPND